MASELRAVSRPAKSDATVMAALTTLRGTLRLDAVPARLSACSGRLARARTASEPFAEVRAQLGEAGAALVRASAGARAAVAQFSGAARAALDDLDDARDLLASAAAPAASAALRAARQRARALAPKARDVALDLELAATVAARAENLARARFVAQRDARAAADAEAADARAALTDARERRALAATALDEVHALYVDADARERTARARASVAHAAQLAAVVGAAAGARSPRLALLGASGVGALCKVANDGVLRAREEKAVFLAQKIRARDRQLDVAKTIESITARLRCATDVADLDAAALDTLSDVVAELRALGAAFLAVESFWLRLRAYCDDPDSSAVDELVDAAAQLPESDQLALWESPRFRIRLREAYAHWIALLSLCEECVKGLDQAADVLHRHISTGDTSEMEVGTVAGEIEYAV